MTRVKRYQRTALVLLVLGGVINYMDRSTLAVGLPLIRKDLGFSIEQSGYLLSAFLWAYAFSQLPAGALVDRMGARVMMTLGLGVWSFAQMLGGMVGNLWQFIGARTILGVGESPQFPTCARVVTDWFPKKERGAATGIWNCSSTLGNAISVPVLTFVMLRLGWRGMFFAAGAAGLIVAGVAWLVHRDPGEVSLTAEERRQLPEQTEEVRRVTLRDWLGLFRSRTTWGMVLGFFGTVYISWLYNTWLPQYLELEWHFSIGKTGWVAAIPYGCGVVGSIVGGRICDALLRRGVAPVTSRKIPFLCAAAGIVTCTVLTAYAPSAKFAICTISASLFLNYIASASAWAMATVAAGGHRAASIGSIQNSGGYIGGALAPIVTGTIVQRTGSFHLALLVGACVAAAAGIAHLVLVKREVE